MATKQFINRQATRHWPLPEKLAYYSVPPNENGCVLWTGYRARGGYGQLHWQGEHEQAHRLAWMVENGPIPDGMFILHRCDVPACINPDHLFIGTAADNMADKIAKGRHTRGAAMSEAQRGKMICGQDHHKAKLTEAQVLEIRAAAGKQRDIAVKFGVTRNLIGMIKARKIWRHLP